MWHHKQHFICILFTFEGNYILHIQAIYHQYTQLLMKVLIRITLLYVMHFLPQS